MCNGLHTGLFFKEANHLRTHFLNWVVCRIITAFKTKLKIKVLINIPQERFIDKMILNRDRRTRVLWRKYVTDACICFCKIKTYLLIKPLTILVEVSIVFYKNTEIQMSYCVGLLISTKPRYLNTRSLDILSFWKQYLLATWLQMYVSALLGMIISTSIS